MAENAALIARAESLLERCTFYGYEWTVRESHGGGPAFPRDHAHDGHNGMTLRDYFAAKALQGFMANKANPMSFHPEQDAQWAYSIADALLRARRRTA